MDTQVGGPISRCWDTTVSVCVPIVAREVEGEAGAEIVNDEGSLVMSQLVWALMQYFTVPHLLRADSE